MTIEGIKQAAKNHLKANNIPFEAGNEKDKCDLYVEKLNNLFYIEVHNEIFERMLTSEDEGYPLQTEESPIPSVSRSAYRFVLDENGNVVIDLAKISTHGMARDPISLDEENILISIRDEDPLDEDPYLNITQHFRIQDGKGTLIRQFQGGFSHDDLLTSKLLITAEGLYNFQNGTFSKNMFDIIIKEEHGVQLLAYTWGIPKKNRRKFVDTIVRKMEKEDIFGEYKMIRVEKEGYERHYCPFIYLDSNGNYVSSLYYVDDCELISIDNITPENIKAVFQQLEENLASEIDAMIAEKQRKKEKKRKFIQQLKMELMKQE